MLWGARHPQQEGLPLSLFCASPIFISPYRPTLGLPWRLSGKEPACHSGDSGSIPGLGRSPAEGNNNLLQYSCLEKPTERGAWWATVHGIAKSQIQLSKNNNYLPTSLRDFLSYTLSSPLFIINPFLAQNSKRHIHPNIHCSTIYNSQDMEAI